MSKIPTKWKWKFTGESTNRQKIIAILFSVFLAMTLWLYVQGTEAPDYKKTFSGVNVVVQSLEDSYSVISGAESTVDITLTGKRSVLNRIKGSDLEAFLDLSQIHAAGIHETDVTVLVPEGSSLYECYPAKVTLFVDQTVSATVPVTMKMGTYTVKAQTELVAEAALSEVEVKGPKTVVDIIDHAEIDSGNLGEVDASFDKTLPYTFMTSAGEAVQTTHLKTAERTMKVHFGVYRVKELPLAVKTLHGYWQDNARFSVTPASVTVKGEPALIDAITQLFAMTLDETTVDTNAYSCRLLPTDLELPEGVTLAETIGDVNVSVKLTDNVSRQIRMNLSSTHVVVTPPESEEGKTLNYAFSTDALSIKIRGSGANINAASADDFYLNIDLSLYSTPGEKEVPVEIVQTDATEGKYYPVGRYTVKVTVSE